MARQSESATEPGDLNAPSRQQNARRPRTVVSPEQDRVRSHDAENLGQNADSEPQTAGDGRNATLCRAVNEVQESTASDRAHQWTSEAVRALGVYTDLVTAGDLLGMGRTKAHELARTDRFPVPVLRHGRRYIVPVAPIARLLHLAEPERPRHGEGTA